MIPHITGGGGGGGGGGNRPSIFDSRIASIEIVVDIEDEKNEKKSSLQRSLAPLPKFLTHSTVEETYY